MIGLVLSAMTGPARETSAAGRKDSARSAALATLTLQGTARSECANAATLASAVEALLLRRVFVAKGGSLAVRLRIDPQSPGWRARIELVRDGKTIGTRDVLSDNPDCRALDDTLALVLALMLDLPEQPTPLHARSPRPDPWRIGIGAGPIATLGWLAQPAFGGRALLEVGPPRGLPLELELAAFPELATGRDSDGFRASAWYFGIAACPRLLESGPALAGGCLGAHVGKLYTRGVGFEPNRSANSPISDVMARAWAALRPSDVLELRLAAGPVVPIARPRVFFRDPGGEERELHHTGPIFAAAELTLLVNFSP